jgi:hypothetical protein
MPPVNVHMLTGLKLMFQDKMSDFVRDGKSAPIRMVGRLNKNV